MLTFLRWEKNIFFFYMVNSYFGTDVELLVSLEFFERQNHTLFVDQKDLVTFLLPALGKSYCSCKIFHLDWHIYYDHMIIYDDLKCKTTGFFCFISAFWFVFFYTSL